MLLLDTNVVSELRLVMAGRGDARVAAWRATALVHRLTVVTRDVEDFARFDGVQVLDPWASHV